MPEPVADIAMIGLAVMGQNLILNMDDHGFTVAVYNRTVSKVDEFLAKEAKGTKVVGAHSIPELVKLLKRPRRVMMLVKAGKAVDEFIEQLMPHLEPGDIIIDGGTATFPTPSGVHNTSSRRACSSSAPAFPAARRERAAVRRSCRAVRLRRGRT